jgi:UDP-N-acetylglucosamine transferase subunit ALG13
MNDHQKQIIEKFSEAGYILGVEDLNKLGETIKKAKTFKPKKYISNTDNLVKIITTYIDNN